MEQLSIAFVTYRDYEALKKAIASIEHHTTLSKKIYIVDNGASVSETDEISALKSFIAQYDDIVYIDTGENKGFGSGHNEILPFINSQYHAILNPDTFLYDDAFLSIIQYMDQHEDVGMVIPRIVDESGVLQKVYRKDPTVFDMVIRRVSEGFFKARQDKHTLQDQDFSRPFQVPFGQGSFLVIRTDLFKRLNGFDDRFFLYLEDADLCKRVNQISKLMYFPGASVMHKWEKGSHKKVALLKHHLKSAKVYFDKWGWKFV